MFESMRSTPTERSPRQSYQKGSDTNIHSSGSSHARSSVNDDLEPSEKRSSVALDNSYDKADEKAGHKSEKRTGAKGDYFVSCRKWPLVYCKC